MHAWHQSNPAYCSQSNKDFDYAWHAIGVYIWWKLISRTCENSCTIRQALKHASSFWSFILNSNIQWFLTSFWPGGGLTSFQTIILLINLCSVYWAYLSIVNSASTFFQFFQYTSELTISTIIQLHHYFTLGNLIPFTLPFLYLITSHLTNKFQVQYLKSKSWKERWNSLLNIMPSNNTSALQYSTWIIESSRNIEMIKTKWTIETP